MIARQQPPIFEELFDLETLLTAGFIYEELVNAVMLMIRYRDAQSILVNEDKTTSPKFKALIKTMLLGYGSTHAGGNKRNGLFLDNYHRDAQDYKYINQTSHLFSAALKEKEKDFSILAPLSSKKGYKRIFRDNKPKKSKFVKRNIGGKKIPFIKKSENTFINFKSHIGEAGQFATRDNQLWIVANTGRFNDKFKEYLTQKYSFIPYENFDEFIEELPYDPNKQQSSIILKENILKKISIAIDEKLDVAPCFYLELFNQLLKPDSLSENLDKFQDEQIQLAWLRLDFLFGNAIRNVHTYSKFFSFIKYAFDELIFLITLTKPYTISGICHNVANFVEKEYGMSPHVTLGGSGMAILTNLISISLDEIKRKDNNTKIYLQSKVYYEMENILGYKLGFKPINHIDEQFISDDGHHGKINIYSPNQVVNLMVCGFNENVTPNKLQYRSKDIFHLIRQQIELRQRQKLENNQ